MNVFGEGSLNLAVIFRRLKTSFFSLLAIFLPVALFAICLSRIDLPRFVDSLGAVRLVAVLAAMGCIFSILLVKSLEWKIFLSPVSTLSFKKIFQVVSLWLMTLNLLPLWMGEALMVYFLGQRERQGKTRVLSSLVLDHTTEGCALVAVFGVLAWASELPEEMKTGIKVIVGVVLLAYSALTILSWRHRDVDVTEDLPAAGLKRLKNLFLRWAHHLHVIRDFRKNIFILSLAVSIKALEALAIFLLQDAFGVNLPWWSPLLVISALNIALMLPLSPGNMGIFEAAVFFVYDSLGVEAGKALGLGIFYHLVYALPFIAMGYVVSLKMGIKRSDLWKMKKEEF